MIGALRVLGQAGLFVVSVVGLFAGTIWYAFEIGFLEARKALEESYGKIWTDKK